MFKHVGMEVPKREENQRYKKDRSHCDVYTVEPLYNGHRWGKPVCPLYRGVLIVERFNILMIIVVIHIRTCSNHNSSNVVFLAEARLSYSKDTTVSIREFYFGGLVADLGGCKGAFLSPGYLATTNSKVSSPSRARAQRHRRKPITRIVLRVTCTGLVY